MSNKSLAGLFMTIIKTTPLTNYLQIDNTLLSDCTIPIKAKTILIYLLSKPKTWNLRVSDLKKRLGIGTHSVRQALKQLQALGYVWFCRLASGRTIWTVTDKPAHNPTQDVDLKPQTDKPRVDSQPVLVRNKKIKIKTTPEPPEPPEPPLIQVGPAAPDVVVASEKNKKIKIAKKIVKKTLINPDLEQDLMSMIVLNVLTNPKIKNFPAYIYGLVGNINEQGYVLATNTSQPDNNYKPKIFTVNNPPDNPKIDNKSWLEKIKKQFPGKVI